MPNIAAWFKALFARLKAWFQSKIVSDWRSVASHYSTKALAAIGAIQGLMALMPSSMLVLHVPFFPASMTYAALGGTLTLVAGVLGIAGKYIDQSK